MGSPEYCYQRDNEKKDSIEVEGTISRSTSTYPPLPLPAEARGQVHLLPVNVNEL